MVRLFLTAALCCLMLVPLMYGYQKSDGLYFRAGVNVFLSWPTLPSPSFTMGYRF